MNVDLNRNIWYIKAVTFAGDFLTYIFKNSFQSKKIIFHTIIILEAFP